MSREVADVWPGDACSGDLEGRIRCTAYASAALTCASTIGVQNGSICGDP
jgi:hypothetical protein